MGQTKLNTTIIILWTVIFASFGSAQTLTGRVISIADGDTITILAANQQQHRIRLHGIDAPERTQTYGMIARENLANFILDKEVTIRVVQPDAGGLTAGQVLLGSIDINLEQLKTGFAWVDKTAGATFSPEEQQAYTRAESQARAARRGLWRESNPTPPWEFREAKRMANNPSDRPAPSVAVDTAKPIVGNKRNKTYYLPTCPEYEKIMLELRVPFANREEAEKAGYKLAKNCS